MAVYSIDGTVHCAIRYPEPGIRDHVPPRKTTVSFKELGVLGHQLLQNRHQMSMSVRLL